VKFGKEWQIYCQNKSEVFSSEKTTKIAIKILQGNAVTKKRVRWLIECSLFANFLWCTSIKTHENRLTYVKVMSEDKVDLFY